jgi:hypothetical protein
MAIDNTRQLIQQITNASSVGENTATRVGTAMEAMLNDVKAADDKAVAATNRINTTEQGIANANQRLTTEEGVNAAQSAQIAGLKRDLQNIRPVTIEGDVVNNPDNVFLTSANDEITPKERTTSLSAKGHYIMRPTDNFAAKLKANYIHEIPFDVDLGGASVTIPANAVLKFTGGKIANGTLHFGNTIIEAADSAFENVVIADCTSTQKVHSAWFGISPSKADNHTALQNLVDQFISVFVDDGTFDVLSPLVISNSSRLRYIESNKQLQGSPQAWLKFPQSDGIIINRRVDVKGLCISGNKGTFDTVDGIYKNGYIGVDCRASCNLYNVDIKDFAIGVDTENGLLVNSIFDGLVVERCGNVGINFVGYSPSNHNNIACTVCNCYITGCGYKAQDYSIPIPDSTGFLSGHGIVIQGGSGNSFYGNTIEYCSGIGAYIKTPTTSSVLRGLYFCGNIFEHNKKANMYFEVNSDNTAIIRSTILIKGNSFSDGNTNTAPLPADILNNRECSLVDRFSQIARINGTVEAFDNTLYETYGKPGIVFDSSLMTRINTDIEEYDYSNGCLVCSSEKRSFYARYIRCRLPIGLYRLVAKVKNSGQNTRNLVFSLRIGGQTVTLSRNISTAWNTYTDAEIGNIISISENNQLAYIDSIEMSSPVSGDKIEIQSIAIVPLESADTSSLSSITGSIKEGVSLFNSTIGKYVTWNGSRWIEGGGMAVGTPRSGNTDTMNSIDVARKDEGFVFYNTDIQKAVCLGENSSPSIGNVRNGVKYVANTLETGSRYYFRIKQFGATPSIRIVFAKTNSTIDDGLEINAALHDVSGINNTAIGYTDTFVAPDSSIYPYIYISTNYTGFTFYEPFALVWVEGDGAIAGTLRSGTTAQRPTGRAIYVGYRYFDTTLGKPVFAKTISGDTVTWVDATGTTV